MIVQAGSEHIDWIVRHRVEMFRSMGWNDQDLDATSSATEKFLRTQWEGEPACYLKIERNMIVGGLAVSHYQVLPSGRNPSGLCAYVLNMFVEPEYRRKGIATELIEFVISKCREKGVGKVALHATEMGWPIYEKAGFTKTENYMEKYL
jgi:GNAT superfamily N-acetyltransferase